MGRVYKAFHRYLKRVVALKLPTNLGREELQRFLREAETMAKLKHSNIVNIHEVGSHNNQPYLTMDFIEGQDLSIFYKKNTLTSKQISQLMITVCDAIHYAHQQGIIHRDLKPANIMMSNGRPIVMDFGLAKNFKDEHKISQSGMILGTITYMSPEQAQGKNRKVDERSDIYSLGVILYELLTDRPPFVNGSSFMLLHDIVKSAPVSPREIKSKIPKVLENVCLKALSKKPKERYQNAKEFADDIRNFLEGKTVNAKAKKTYVSWLQKNRILVQVGTFITLAVVFSLLVFSTLHYRSKTNHYTRLLNNRYNFQGEKTLQKLPKKHKKSLKTLVDEYHFLKRCKNLGKKDLENVVAMHLQVPSLKNMRKELIKLCLEEGDIDYNKVDDKKKKEGFRALEYLVKLDPKNERGLLVFANLLFSRNEFQKNMRGWEGDKFIKILEQAVTYNPQDHEIKAKYGYVLVKNKKNFKGTKLVAQALAKIPEQEIGWLYYYLGFCYEEEGRLLKADVNYSKALEQFTDNQWLNYWYGKFLIEKKGEVSQGMKIWKELYPKLQNQELGEYHTKVFYREYTKILRKAGFFDEAVEAYKKAIETVWPKHPFYFYLGHCYVQMRQNKNAIQAYKKSIEEMKKHGDDDLKYSIGMYNEMKSFIDKYE